MAYPKLATLQGGRAQKNPEIASTRGQERKAKMYGVLHMYSVLRTALRRLFGRCGIMYVRIQYIARRRLVALSAVLACAGLPGTSVRCHVHGRSGRSSETDSIWRSVRSTPCPVLRTSYFVDSAKLETSRTRANRHGITGRTFSLF